MRAMCPSADDAMARWWGQRARAAATPSTVRSLIAMNSLDRRPRRAPAVRVPTLVMHRRGDRTAGSRRAATSPSTSRARGSSSCPARTTSSPSTRTRSSTRWRRSSPTSGRAAAAARARRGPRGRRERTPPLSRGPRGAHAGGRPVACTTARPRRSAPRCRSSTGTPAPPLGLHIAEVPPARTWSTVPASRPPPASPTGRPPASCSCLADRPRPRRRLRPVARAGRRRGAAAGVPGGRPAAG